MTIGTATARVSFNCNGSTTVFPIPIQAYLASDFEVIHVTAAGASNILNLNSDYTMATSGTLSPTAWTMITTVTYPSGDTLQVILNPTQTQQTQYVQGQQFPSLSLQTNVDRLTQMVLRLQDQINRSLRAPDQDNAPTLLLPAAAARAGTSPYFDSNGNLQVATSIPAGTLSLATIAPILNLNQTSQEAALSITPSNISYEPGNPWRYGADGTGGANDVAALASAAQVAAASGVTGWKNGVPAGAFLRTAAEVAAGVIPTNFNYGVQPYDIRRYGALGNGSNDDTAALNTALVVASQSVNGALGSAIFVPIGIFVLSSMVLLPNRVRVLGANKRGSYFRASSSWAVGNGVAAWNSGTGYTTGNFVTNGGVLYVAKQASTNQAPPNATYWNPISNAMFYAQNGYTSGSGNSMFDSTLENLTVDANNVASLGCVLSSAWQEDCGLRGVMLINYTTYGIRWQDGFGGASLSKIVDAELFQGTTSGTIGVDLTSPMGGVAAFMLDVSNTSITGSSAGLAAAGISCKGNSLTCRQVHFENTTAGVLLDGVGYTTLIDVTGAGSSPVGVNLLQLASTFTGSLNALSLRRNGFTNYLNDGRTGGYGAIGGYDIPLLTINAQDPSNTAKGSPYASAWAVWTGTATAWSGVTSYVPGNVVSLAGVFYQCILANTNQTPPNATYWTTAITPTNSYNVTSFSHPSTGQYNFTFTRPCQSANVALFAGANNGGSGGAVVDATSDVGAQSCQVNSYINGSLADLGEMKLLAFGG